MFQQVMIIGNLGRDPEMRYTQTGVPVTSFSVATSRRWTGQDGQSQEKTVWFRVSAWQKLAETTNQFLTKGSRVMVIGEIDEPRIYTAPDGTVRAALEMRANTVRFLTPKGEGGFGDSDVQPVERGGYSGGASNGGSYGGSSSGGSQGEDDIPF